MAIREQITIEVAAVEVNDEYVIELRQMKKRTAYSAEQARTLAGELIEAAEHADELIRADGAALRVRLERGLITTENGEVVL